MKTGRPAVVNVTAGRQNEWISGEPGARVRLVKRGRAEPRLLQVPAKRQRRKVAPPRAVKYD